MRGGVKRLEYRLHYVVRLQENIIVPEPQDSITGCFQITGTFDVIRTLLLMLTAINLNYQSPVQANEIGYVWPHRVLSSELEVA